jgi:hypothetical protein
VFGGLCCFFAIVISLWSIYSPGFQMPNVHRLTVDFRQIYLHPLFTTMLTIDRSLQFVRCMMFISLVGLSRALRLHWRNNVMNIATGFAIFAAAELIISSLHSLLGSTAYPGLANIRSFAYLVSLSIWIAQLCQSAPQRVLPPPTEVRKLERLHEILRENPTC